MPKAPKINVTKDYRLFRHAPDNRPLDLGRHSKLRENMEKEGFYPHCPIICIRDDDRNLIVKDGQHRLAFAEALGLSVYWLEAEKDFNVADMNNTQKAWVPKDYALRFAADGARDYDIGVKFHEEFNIPVGLAFSLLSGTTTFGNISEAFYSGQFKVRDREYARSVAGLYVALGKLAPKIKNARLIEACMALCRVADFEASRMLRTADRLVDRLQPFATRDACLERLEEIYNHMQKTKLPLKFLAVAAMKSRNPRTKKPD